MGKLVILTGKRFGRLVVRKRVPWSGRGHSTRWECICDCGKTTECGSSNLCSGNTLSCGCLRLEKTIESHKTHGKTKTPEYRNWSAMKYRCLCETSQDYPAYGGSGVRISDRWIGRDGFENFLSDMGKRPTKLHSLDRFPNRDGNYEPGNVRWASPIEQRHNQDRWLSSRGIIEV